MTKELKLCKLKDSLKRQIRAQVMAHEISKRTSSSFDNTRLYKLLTKLECVNAELNNINGTLSTVSINSLQLN